MRPLVTLFWACDDCAYGVQNHSVGPLVPLSWTWDDSAHGFKAILWSQWYLCSGLGMILSTGVLKPWWIHRCWCWISPCLRLMILKSHLRPDLGSIRLPFTIEAYECSGCGVFGSFGNEPMQSWFFPFFILSIFLSYFHILYSYFQIIYSTTITADTSCMLCKKRRGQDSTRVAQLLSISCIFVTNCVHWLF